MKIFSQMACWLCAIAFFWLIAACAPAPQGPPPEERIKTEEPIHAEQLEEVPETEEPAALPQPTEHDPADAPAQDEALPQLEPLESAPQAVSFQTSDGRSIEGRYYPAATNPGPVIVLLHWAPGTQDDWAAIAPWLQNRGQAGGEPGSSTPYLDPSWFPELPAEVSFGVLTFNFGGRGTSQAGDGAAALLQDTIAALQAASRLPGVDPHRIVTIGASIGADGAADSCDFFNNMDDQSEGTCLGALSLSPGDYLGVSYSGAVGALQAETPPKTAYCLGAEDDGNVAEVCRSGEGESYRVFIYTGSAHGMSLWRPEIEPNTVEIVLDFLGEVYGLSLN